MDRVGQMRQRYILALDDFPHGIPIRPCRSNRPRRQERVDVMDAADRMADVRDRWIKMADDSTDPQMTIIYLSHASEADAVARKWTRRYKEPLWLRFLRWLVS